MSGVGANHGAVASPNTLPDEPAGPKSPGTGSLDSGLEPDIGRNLGTVAIVLVSSGFLLLVHELGHLLAAKTCGMKISKYYLGFHVAADLRSFAAKAVWQRMVVIAAGSLMNLVFAVAVAAVAYRLGVSYTPCILGGTTAGDPAWELGFRPGDKILQIGRSGRPNEHLRFDKDLVTAVTLHGTATELDILVRRYGQLQPEWVSIQPSGRLRHGGARGGFVDRGGNRRHR